MTPTASNTLNNVLNALSVEFNASNLIGIIVSSVAVTVVFGVIWFATGYVRRRISGAFKNGNI